MLSMFFIAFLLRRRRFYVFWLQSPSAVILEPPKIKCVVASTFFPSITQWMFWGIMGRTDIELAVGKQGLGTTSGWGMLVPVTVMEGWGGADLYWGRGQEFCTYSLAQLRGVRRTRAPWLMCPGNRDHHAGQVGVQSGSTHTGCVQTKETGEMRLLFGTCQPFLP